MNLQKIVILCIAVAAVGIGWYLVTKDTDVVTKSTYDENSDSRVVIEETSNNEKLSGMATFAELMGLGQNLMCDFSYVAADTNGAVAGTVYISGERMRGDFDMEQAGQLFESHMIDDGAYVYSWSITPQGTFGFKSLLDTGEIDTESSDDNTATARTVDMNHEVDYDCKTWRVDESVFVPPSSVEFISPEDMMNGFMPTAQ